MFHLFHEWKAVAVYHYRWRRPLTNTAYEEMPTGTTVLSRCALCGKVKTQDLEGKFTLEQINGN